MKVNYTDKSLEQTGANYTPHLVQIDVRTSSLFPDTIYGVCKDGIVWVRVVAYGSYWKTLDDYLEVD